MSLEWKVGDIKDYKTLCYQRNSQNNLNPVTEALIWRTMSIGLPNITSANCDKFFQRIFMYERAMDATLKVHDTDGRLKDRPITYADVRQHIGLKTNSHSWTDAQFHRNLDKWLKYRATEALYAEKQSMEKTTEASCLS